MGMALGFHEKSELRGVAGTNSRADGTVKAVLKNLLGLPFHGCLERVGALPTSSRIGLESCMGLCLHFKNSR